MGEKATREDCKAETERIDSSFQDLREQLRDIGRRLSRCETLTQEMRELGSNAAIDQDARESIGKACGDISRVIKLLVVRMTERQESTKAELEKLSSGVGRVRDVAKKLAEIIARTKEEIAVKSKKLERVTRVVADVEKNASGIIDRLTQEFMGMKRVLQDSIDEIKTRLEKRSVPESARTAGAVSSGSADRLIAKRLGDLEIRTNEASSNRKDEAQRDHIAEIRGEIADLRNKFGSTRENSRGPNISSRSATPGAWRDSIAGVRQNIEEISMATKRVREDTRRLNDRQERVAAESDRMREEIRAAQESIKQSAVTIAEQKRENGRLNARIDALVGLWEESQQRMGTMEALTKNQRDVSNLGPKVIENREDINNLRA